MRNYLNIIVAYSIMMLLIILVGIFQSWSIALTIFNYCMISAVMTLGANIQWGYAGLINFGIMGYTALGGLAVVLVSVAPVPEAWSVGGVNMMTCLGIIIIMIFSTRYILKNIQKSKKRNYFIAGIIIVGLILIKIIAGPAIEQIEAVDPAKTGFLGGLGLPVLFSWIVGGLFAAGLAFIVGKVALGLRADYLAIATLLIAEIVVSIIKHEDWLARGVKNVIGLKRPAPYEIDLQTSPWFINLVEKFHSAKLDLANSLSERQDILNQLVIDASSVYVKLCFAGMFLVVVMVIVGGTGNNFGAILGGFVVWFLWVEAAPIALFFINLFTAHLPETNEIKVHLINSAPYFRFLLVGIGLLLIMRFRPQGIIPEKIIKQ